MVIFKKIRLISWITKAFLSKHGKIIIAAFSIGILGFFVITRFAHLLPQPKPKQRIAKIGRYSPDQLPQDILKNLSLGLTTTAKDGSAAPGLAKDWQISKNGLEYTFILREDLRWQDGDKITTQDIDYQFSDVSKEILNEKKVKFTLKEPFAPFPTILTKPLFKQDFVGVGPYQIKKIKKTGNIVEWVSLSSKEKIIVYKFYPTQEAALTAFKLGKVDSFDFPLEQKLKDDWQKNIKIQENIAKDRFVGIFFNTDKDFLTDKSIRQALAYSIKDKPRGELRATGPISPLSWAYNQDVKLYQFDPQKAKELFSDSEGKKITISTTQPFLNTAEKIKQSWQETLGLEVNINLINNIPGDYQVFLGIQQIPADPDQYLFWHSTREENITHLKNAKIDKVLEDGRQIVDQKERLEKYQDFQQFISEECPAVFYSHPVYYNIEREELFTWF